MNPRSSAGHQPGWIPKLSLCLIPAAVVALALILARAQGPYSNSQNLDPDYNYLFNSLNLLMLRAPRHIDHPGTTVQELGAVAVLVKRVAERIEGDERPLEVAVLTEPEDYLRTINTSLATILGTTMVAAGLAMLQTTGSLIAAVLLQSGVFFFLELQLALPRVSPEPLLLAIVYAMMVPLIPALLDPKRAFKFGAATTGALWGFGVVTKLTFLPLALVALVFPGWRSKARFAVAASIAAVVFSIPIWTQLGYVGGWLYRILTHSERYGNGPVGLPSSDAVLANARDLFHREPLLLPLFAIYAAVLIVLALQSNRGPFTGAMRRIWWIGLVVIAIQLTASLKHYFPRYMLPAMALMLMMNSLLFLWIRSAEPSSSIRIPLAILAAAIFLGGIGNTIIELPRWAQHWQLYTEEAHKLDADRKAQGDCMSIGYYSSSLPSFSLAFGSEYSGAIHGRMLKRLYSDQIHFNRFGGGFRSFSMEGRLKAVEEHLQKGGCVLLQGGGITAGEKLVPGEFVLEPISHYTMESLYRLRLANH